MLPDMWRGHFVRVLRRLKDGATNQAKCLSYVMKSLPERKQLVGRCCRTGGSWSPAQVDQVTQNVQRLVALRIDGGLFGAVVVARQIRVGVGGSFRGNFLFR